ncbi:hypothetical protein [Sphingomonas echinoides]|uniref:hypothetical protein n=1 Tax=Sphingomonas echinoides TaxID=59803 RepID=UPI002413516A|nr:hypothetical protein [Sphingomonas echinoides]
MALLMLMMLAQATMPTDFDLARTAAPTTRARCVAAGQTDDIVVCGGRRDRFRLPLPVDRSGEPSRSDQGTGMGALTPPTPCGLFAGQRKCAKHEARKYGYGGGRDPVTLLSRLATKALDPDAD